MLVNQRLKTPTVVFKLVSSDYKFYATGSRYWGNSHDRSDWDFFVQDSTEVRDYLASLGFVTDIARHYDADRHCRAVFVYGDEDIPEMMVQIQLVSSDELKHSVQQTLLRRFPNGFETKEKAKQIWSLAYDCFDSALNFRIKQSSS